VIPSDLIPRVIAFCVLVIKVNASSRLVAAGGGKKGRFSFLLAEILKEASDTTIRIIEHYGQLIIRA
jgi:hypothetical protein